LLESQTFPLTSQRTPSGPHFTPSTVQSVNSFWFDSVLSDVEHVDVALAARAGVARPFAGRGDVELLVIVRECEAVGIGHLLLADDKISSAARSPSAFARQVDDDGQYCFAVAL
jgi:hypothetical protein